MNVLLTFDDNYCQHAAVVLASLCKNNTQESISVYVITDYISETNKDKIGDILKCYNATIQYIIIDYSSTKDLPFGKGTSNKYITNIATYYRLFVTELLPKDIERILYLDCDIVINDSLNILWTWEFSSGSCIAAVEEMPSIIKESTFRLNYPVDYSYFNAGIILFDLTKLRKMYSVEVAFDFINKHRTLIKYHDQDVLNALLYKQKDFLPIKYNLMEGFLYRLNTNWERCKNNEDDILNPAIIHFAGPLKPWYKECNHPYKQLYYEYLRMTPWKNYVPVYRYNTVKENCIYHFKSFLKFILDTLNLKAYRFRKDLPLLSSAFNYKQGIR